MKASCGDETGRDTHGSIDRVSPAEGVDIVVISGESHGTKVSRVVSYRTEQR